MDWRKFLGLACVIFLATGTFARGETNEHLKAKWTPQPESGLSLKDTSSHGCDLMLGNGNKEKAPDSIGKALDFNGRGDFAVSKLAQTLQDYPEITVLAWVYPHDVKPLMTSRYAVSQNVKLSLYLDKENRPGGSVSIQGKGWVNVNGKTPITQDTWSNLALTYDRKTISLYLDGVLAGSVAETGEVSKGADAVWLGSPGWADNYYWAGLLGETRIYGKALSGEGVNAVMNESKPDPLPAGYVLKSAKQGPALVANGEFEGDFTNYKENIKIARGWTWNAWGTNSFIFSKETGTPYAGSGSQRLEVSSFTDGGIALCQQTALMLDINKTYVLSGYFKGENTGDVQLILRDKTYNALIGKTFKPTAEWKRYAVEAKPTQSGAAAIYIIVSRPEQNCFLLIDNVNFTEKK